MQIPSHKFVEPSVLIFAIIYPAFCLFASVISAKSKSTLAWSLNVTIPRVSYDPKELIIVLTECLTKSNLENPSDSTAPPWVASVSMEPDMSRTHIIEIAGLFWGSAGEVIFTFTRRSPSTIAD